MDPNIKKEEIFSEVQATINTDLFSQELSLNDLCKQYGNDRVKIEHKHGTLLAKGTLQDITTLQQHLWEMLLKDNNIPDVVVLGKADNEVKSLITEVLNKNKNSEIKGALQNKPFKLMPFCVMLRKHYPKLRSHFLKVNILPKSVHLPEVRFTFKAKTLGEIDNFLEQIDCMYKEDTFYIHKTVENTGQYSISELIRAMNAHLKPKLFVILNSEEFLLEIDPQKGAEFEKLCNDFQVQWKNERYLTPNVGPSSIKQDKFTLLSAGASNYADTQDKIEAMDFTTADLPRHTISSPRTQELHMDPDTMTYIHLFHQNELDEIAAKYDLVIQDAEANDGTLVIASFTGTHVQEDAVNELSKHIQNIHFGLIHKYIDITHLIEKVDEKWKEIIKAGGLHQTQITNERDKKLFVSGIGDSVTQTIAVIKQILGIKRNRILVQGTHGNSYVQEKSAFDESRATRSLPPTFNRYSSENVPSVSLIHKKSQVKVLTAVRDITRMKVDAIVNAANEDLLHCGGVALAISVAGGAKVDDESRKYVKSNGKLSITGTCITSAGKMPCKKVIHAVGPIWKTMSPEVCLNKLTETFENVLKTATKEGFQSIAIPAISSGIYGMPASLVADTAVIAVTQYLNSNYRTPLHDIHLVDIDATIISNMQAELANQVNANVYTYLSIATTPAGSSVGEGAKAKGPKPESAKPGRPLSMGSHSHKTYASTVSDSRNSQKEIPEIHKQTGSRKAKKESTKVEKKEKHDDCCICMSPPSNPKTLTKCKHTFCTECIDRSFKHKPTCPVCGEIYGQIIGNQPEGGKMDVFKDHSTKLAGYKDCGTIVIDYTISSGRQTKNMPNPGQLYSGTTRRAYLPDNKEGNKVVKLLQKAFKSRLIFTVGISRTSGLQDTVTWNDIHHKTNTYGGPERFGYPDSTYLSRVQEELAAKGIK